MRRHFRNLAAQDRRELVMYGWMMILSLGLAVALTALFVNISQRHRTQVETNARTCAEVNYVVDYLNVYFAAATPARLRSEQKVIDKVFPPGPVRAVLDGIFEAQIANPTLGGLHPFRLPDLPCAIHTPVGATGATSSTRS